MTNEAVQATAHRRHHHRYKFRVKFSSTRMFELELRPIPEVNSSGCTCRECVAGSDSESSCQVVYTDQASSRVYDTGRATTGKASGWRTRRWTFVDGIAISATEDEDPGEYFVNQQRGNGRGDESQAERTCPTASVCSVRHFHLQVALGKKRVTTRWHIDYRRDSIRARFVAREFKGDEAMYDAFAPSVSLKKSWHSRRDKRAPPRG